MGTVQAAGMCARGAANKLTALGYDRARIRDIITNGIPVSEAERVGDGLMDILVAKAREMHAESERANSE